MTDEKNMLDEEHEELIEALGEVAREKTEVGRLFSEVLGIFRTHLNRENETIIPLLGYLKDRLGGYDADGKEALNIARMKFEDSYPEMIQEHEDMAKLIRSAQELLKNTPDRLASDLAGHLLHHVELEEELLYPAAFASGDLVEYELELPGEKIKQ
ncbi:Hemerythrin HHE cation binding domain protein [Thermoplasmatales archaeon]|nr:Hemerythrin HHE cation binding domain protein [Thermoplasmatales archaeon]